MSDKEWSEKSVFTKKKTSNQTSEDTKNSETDLGIGKGDTAVAKESGTAPVVADAITPSATQTETTSAVIKDV